MMKILLIIPDWRKIVITANYTSLSWQHNCLCAWVGRLTLIFPPPGRHLEVQAACKLKFAESNQGWGKWISELSLHEPLWFFPVLTCVVKPTHRTYYFGCVGANNLFQQFTFIQLTQHIPVKRASFKRIRRFDSLKLIKNTWTPSCSSELSSCCGYSHSMWMQV